MTPTAEPRHTADTITSDALDELYAERDEHRQNYLNACKTIAAMHTAAVGDVRGPERGVVKDVEDVRLRAEHAEQERDRAYRERAHLVALLAAMTPYAVIAPAPDIDEPGWQIAYLQIGGQQASWHISPRDADLFNHLEHVPADDPRARWDGHTTDDKYARIRQHTQLLMRSCGPECAEMHRGGPRCQS
jgi:hypothetical protein